MRAAIKSGFGTRIALSIAMALASSLSLSFALSAQVEAATPQTAPRLLEISVDDDRIAEQVLAFEEAILAGDSEKAVFLGQRFIEAAPDLGADPGSFTARHLVAAPGEPDLHLDGRYLVARRLASAAPELQQRYQLILEDRARACRDGLAPLGALAELAVARDFPLSRAGLAAAGAAAQAALESGRFTLAARLFGDLIDLDWRAPESRQSARRAGLLLALAALGEDAGRELTTDTGLTRVGNRKIAVTQLAAELRADLEAARPNPFGGLRPGPLTEIWNRPLPGWEIEGGEDLLPRPLVCGQQLIHHDRGGVESLDLATGALLWERPFGGEEDDDLREMDDPDLLSLGGALCDDLYLVVHAALGPDERQDRVLVALDCRDGSEVWRFDPRALEGELADLVIDPDPLTDGETIWVTAFDDRPTPRCHVLAIEPLHGRLIGATRLPSGVPLTRLDPDARAEPKPARHWLRAAPLRLVQGFLLVCDQLGHVAALEADSLEPRFLARYDRRLGIDSRVSATIDARGFDQGRILAAGDRILVAPDDADQIMAFFLRPPADARRRTENSLCQRAASFRRDGLGQLIAFDGSSLVAAGRDLGENLDVIKRMRVFVDAPPGTNWSEPLDSAPLGEGILHQKAVYLCTHKYVYGTDLSDGAVFGPLVSREADGDERLGNLIAVKTGLIVASRRGLRAYRPVP